MCRDEEFRQLILTWAHVTKLTNMGCERILALIKKAAFGTGPDAAPDVERVAAAGTLTQWLTTHLAAGGSDPRVMTREQAIEDGAQLQCRAKRCKRATRPAGGFVAFSNHRRGERKASGEVLDKDAAKLERDALSREWSALDDDAKQVWSDTSQRAHDDRELDRLTSALGTTDPDPNPTHMYKVGVLWGLGEKRFPLAKECFIRQAKAACGDDALPGSRRYCSALREDFHKSIFIEDRGRRGNL